MSTETIRDDSARPPPGSLLPEELRERIPALYATENTDDPIVHAKLFTPWTNWTWFVTEFDGEETCFGLVSGLEVELGYFSLAELEATRGPGGIRIERDLHFKQQPLSEVRQHLERLREGPDGFEVREEADAPKLARNASTAATPNRRKLPSPTEQPEIRLVDTTLDTNVRSSAFEAVASPREAASILHELIGEADREHFVTLFLNAKNRITHAHIVSRGTQQASLVHPREVFKAAVLANAAAIIVGHNHPSGRVEPSPEDKAVVERLEQAGELLGIAVLDSIIVGSTGCFYTSSSDDVQVLPSTNVATQKLNADARGDLAAICEGLLQDIGEVLERQGESWWDETVTSGTHHRMLAEKHLGLAPYEPPANEGARLEPSAD